MSTKSNKPKWTYCKDCKDVRSYRRGDGSRFRWGCLWSGENIGNGYYANCSVYYGCVKSRKGGKTPRKRTDND